jgi:hypothetical protein
MYKSALVTLCNISHQRVYKKLVCIKHKTHDRKRCINFIFAYLSTVCIVCILMYYYVCMYISTVHIHTTIALCTYVHNLYSTVYTVLVFEYHICRAYERHGLPYLLKWPWSMSHCRLLYMHFPYKHCKYNIQIPGLYILHVYAYMARGAVFFFVKNYQARAGFYVHKYIHTVQYSTISFIHTVCMYVCMYCIHTGGD